MQTLLNDAKDILEFVDWYRRMVMEGQLSTSAYARQVWSGSDWEIAAKCERIINYLEGIPKAEGR